jgi:hypothetical protein
MGSKQTTRSDPKEGIIMQYMIGDEQVYRKCLTCKEVKSEPAEWWEFVSWSCQECDNANYFKAETKVVTMDKITNPCPLHPDEEILLYGRHDKPGSKMLGICNECCAVTVQYEKADDQGTCGCPVTAECQCIREADEYEAWLNSRDYY